MTTPHFMVNRARILYMEDDKSLAQLVKRRLGREGFDVDTVPDGAAGLAQLKTTAYDVVVLDYKMPNLDGMTVLKQLVADPSLPPAVMVSGVASLEVAVEAMRIGAADYVIKESGGNYLQLLPGVLTKVLEKQSLIVEKAKAEAALRESEQRFRSVTNSTVDAIISANHHGNIIFWNRGAAIIFGYQEAEILGASLTQLMPERYQQRHSNGLQRVLETGKAHRVDQVVELVGLHKDGFEFPMEISFASWVVNDNRFFSAVVRDVTERKRSQEEIARKTVIINNILNSSPDLAIAATDLNFRITYYNTVAERIFGYSKEQAIGQTVQDIHTREKVKPERFERAVAIVRREGVYRYSVEQEKNGEMRTISSKVSGILNQDDEIIGFLLISQDITEQKRMENDLRIAKENAEKATQAKSAFLATMSHEIRTPMNAILGMGEVLKDSGINREQSDYLRVLTNAGESLLALINDILDLSKVEAGQLAIEARSFDLYEFIEGTQRILVNIALAKGIALNQYVQPDSPRLVVGDPERLRQVLLNLLGNAIKFTEYGVISLTVTPWQQDFIRFTVTDTGIGIPELQLMRIFEPFKQADESTSRRFGGTGLGLSICKRLVEAMGGTIQVESKLGQGSAFHFTIRLPRSMDMIADDHLTRVTRKEERVNMSELPMIKTAMNILMVDDAEDNRMVVSSFLRKTSHRLTEAVNGEEGVKQFKSGRFDLVLMDMQMPILDGFNATKLIRQWEKEQGLPATPIAALTASAMKEDMDKTSEAGCTIHLSKPIRKAHLLEVIAQFSQ